MKKLIVAAVNSSNFFQLDELEVGVYEGVGGFEYELLKILSSMLDFEFDLVTPEDGTWGNKNEDGQYGGLVGMLQRQEADMVVEIVTATHERSKVVDFAFPHAVDRVSFTIKKAGLVDNNLAYLYPFQSSVWMSIILSLVSYAFLFAFGQRYQSRTPGIIKYFDGILRAFEILISNRAFRNMDRLSSKILFGFSNMATRFLSLCFSAVLLSFLMSPTMEHQITTFTELATASKSGKVRVTTIGNSFLQAMLMDETSAISQDLSIHLRSHPQSYTKHGAQDNIPVILEQGFAFIENIRLTRVKAYEIGKNEDLFFSQESLQMIPVAIAFRKGFCCIKEFNEVIIRLHGSGILRKLFNDHLYRLRLKSQNEMEKSSPAHRSLPFRTVRGIFIILILCYGLGILIVVSELVWWKQWHR